MAENSPTEKLKLAKADLEKAEAAEKTAKAEAGKATGEAKSKATEEAKKASKVVTDAKEAVKAAQIAADEAEEAAKVKAKAEKKASGNAEVTNNHNAPLGLPKGPTIPPGKTVKIDNWNVLRNHSVIKTWVKAKAITVEAESDQGEDVDDL